MSLKNMFYSCAGVEIQYSRKDGRWLSHCFLSSSCDICTFNRKLNRAVQYHHDSFTVTRFLPRSWEVSPTSLRCPATMAGGIAESHSAGNSFVDQQDFNAWPSRFSRKSERLLLLLWILSLPLLNPIVHGDGVGYYAYARALLIQHNLRFEEDWRHANLNFC